MNELKDFVKYMTEEVSNLVKGIEYTEQFLLDEDPEFYGMQIAEMQSELDAAVKYDSALTAY